MSELKITIDQLKNYLGTGLMMQYEGFGENREQIIENWTISREEFLDINFKSEFSNNEEDVLFYFKPICYRLSDLDKFIPELGFVPFKRLLNNEPEKDDSIEIEFIEGTMPFQKRFRAFAWVDYPDGESRKEHLSDFFLNGNHGMVPFSWMQQLFQWHFWPFGEEYFEAGLVIDKLKMTEK